MSRIELWIDDGTERGYSLGQFAAPEAERLTSTAEPDASLRAVLMSGGAEPAGAAKHHA